MVQLEDTSSELRMFGTENVKVLRTIQTNSLRTNHLLIDIQGKLTWGLVLLAISVGMQLIQFLSAF